MDIIRFALWKLLLTGNTDCQYAHAGILPAVFLGNGALSVHAAFPGKRYTGGLSLQKHMDAAI